MQENIKIGMQTEHRSDHLIRTREHRKKGKQSRRVLPKIGTVERLEILREDAKKRRRDAASRHSCPSCSYSAPFPSKVKRHIANRHSKAHSCSKCDKHFDNFSELRTHVSVEHAKIHHCEFCSFSHKLRAEVRKHIAVHHVNGVTCTVRGCNLRIARWRLKKHLQTNHPESFEPVSLRSERLTVASMAEDSVYNCAHCEFITSDIQDFNWHIMNAHDTGLQCPYLGCSERVLLNDLDRHLVLVHEQADSGVEIYAIDECHKYQMANPSSRTGCSSSTVSESTSTLNHAADFSSDSEDFNTAPKSYCKLVGSNTGMQCALCGREYHSSYLLKKHIKTVHEKMYAQYRRVRKYICDWGGCKKAFTTSGLLEDHLNSHKGIKPYNCSSCGISFAARSRFAVHLSKYHKMSIRDYKSFSELLTLSAHNNFPH